MNDATKLLLENPARFSPLLASLFSSSAAAAELRSTVDASLLFPEEAALLKKAIPKRVQEFTAGRLCVRHAVARLGARPFPLLPNEDRSPQWPDTLTGSITHTHGFAGAVVGQRLHFRAIGIDAEVIGRVGENLWPQICTPAEIAWLHTLPDLQQTQAATLLFAAKEAFYKCQHVLTREWLGFQAVCLDPVEITAELSDFVIRPMQSIKLMAYTDMPLRGAFKVDGDLLLAGVSIAAV